MSSPFLNTTSNFQAGNIAKFVDNWLSISNDPWVLSEIQGSQIPFVAVPIQERAPYPYRLSGVEAEFMDGEVVRMLHKGIIEETGWEPGQFISNVFLRPSLQGVSGLSWTSQI